MGGGAYLTNRNINNTLALKNQQEQEADPIAAAIRNVSTPVSTVTPTAVIPKVDSLDQAITPIASDRTTTQLFSDYGAAPQQETAVTAAPTQAYDLTNMNQMSQANAQVGADGQPVALGFSYDPTTGQYVEDSSAFGVQGDAAFKRYSPEEFNTKYGQYTTPFQAQVAEPVAPTSWTSGGPPNFNAEGINLNKELATNSYGGALKYSQLPPEDQAVVDARRALSTTKTETENELFRTENPDFNMGEWYRSQDFNSIDTSNLEKQAFQDFDPNRGELAGTNAAGWARDQIEGQPFVDMLKKSGASYEQPTAKPLEIDYPYGYDANTLYMKVPETGGNTSMHQGFGMEELKKHQDLERRGSFVDISGGTASPGDYSMMWIQDPPEPSHFEKFLNNPAVNIMASVIPGGQVALTLAKGASGQTLHAGDWLTLGAAGLDYLQTKFSPNDAQLIAESAVPTVVTDPNTKLKVVTETAGDNAITAAFDAGILDINNLDNDLYQEIWETAEGIGEGFLKSGFSQEEITQMLDLAASGEGGILDGVDYNKVISDFINNTPDLKVHFQGLDTGKDLTGDAAVDLKTAGEVSEALGDLLTVDDFFDTYNEFYDTALDVEDIADSFNVSSELAEGVIQDIITTNPTATITDITNELSESFGNGTDVAAVADVAGVADVAQTADVADVAKVAETADVAATADVAKVAEQAQTAAVAAVAAMADTADVAKVAEVAATAAIAEIAPTAEVAAVAQTAATAAVANMADTADVAKVAEVAAVAATAAVAAVAKMADTADVAEVAKVAETAAVAAVAEVAKQAKVAEVAETAAVAAVAAVAEVAPTAPTAEVAAVAKQAAVAAVAEMADTADVAEVAKVAETAATASIAKQAAVAAIAEVAETADVAEIAQVAATAAVASVAPTAEVAAVAETAAVAAIAEIAKTADVAQVAEVASVAATAAVAAIANVAETASVAEVAEVAKVAAVAAVADVSGIEKAVTEGVGLLGGAIEGGFEGLGGALSEGISGLGGTLGGLLGGIGGSLSAQQAESSDAARRLALSTRTTDSLFSDFEGFKTKIGANEEMVKLTQRKRR